MKRNRTLVAVLLALALAGGWGAPALVANEEHEEAHGHEAGEAEARLPVVWPPS